MDYVRQYTDFLKQHAKISRPLKIVCDSSNGATGIILKTLLPELDLAEYSLINDNPDPEFSAHGPNPLLPGATDELINEVKKKKADLGVIFDADGDRAFFIDERGRPLPSFIIASLLFKYRPTPFVADELIYEALRTMGIFGEGNIHASKVGFVYIRQTMKRINASSGAEFSGHYCFRDFFNCDSGIFAMLQILSFLSSMNESLSNYADALPPHSVVNEDLKISGKDFASIQKKLSSIYPEKNATVLSREGFTAEFSHGWINARPSNTEPILRLYAGARIKEEATALLNDLKSLV